MQDEVNAKCGLVASSLLSTDMRHGTWCVSFNQRALDIDAEVTIKYRAVGTLRPLIKFRGQWSSVGHLRRRKVCSPLPLLSRASIQCDSRSITGFHKSQGSRDASRLYSLFQNDQPIPGIKYFTKMLSILLKYQSMFWTRSRTSTQFSAIANC